LALFLLSLTTVSYASTGIEGNIDALRNGDPVTRKAAARTLGNSGNPQAVEPLVKALGDESGGVKIAAIRALGELKDKRAVAPLVDLMKRSTTSTSLDDKHIAQSDRNLLEVSIALGKIRDPSAVPEIKHAIDRVNKVAANSPDSKHVMAVKRLAKNLQRVVKRLER